MSNRQETVSTSSTLAPKYRIPQQPTYKKSYGRKFRDFIARCGHYIRPIRKYILPNFLAVHYFYIIFISILASILMYPCRNAKYIDILFLATGASTQGGLNTINLNQLNTYQQVILYLTSFVTTPIAIHGSLAFVRLYWFERYFDGIKEFSKNDFKIRRTKTILQREMTRQSMQTWRTRTFTNTGRFGSNSSYINSNVATSGNKPLRARGSSRVLYRAGTSGSNAFPRADSRLKFIETGSHRSRVTKRYTGDRRASAMSSFHGVYNGRKGANTTTPSESFQERLFSGNLFRRDSDLEGASTSISMSNDTASTIRSGSGGTRTSSYGRDLSSVHGGRLSNTRSTSARPVEQGTLWSSQSRSRSRSRGRSMSPHYEHRLINSPHKTGTPSYERFAKMRNPSEIQPQDVYRSLHMMMNQLNNESNESEDGPPLVVQSPFEALATRTASKFGTPVQYKLTRSEEELASRTTETTSSPPVSPSPSSLSTSLRGDVGEPSIIRRDSEDMLHPNSSTSLEGVDSEPTGRELPQGVVSEIVGHGEVSPTELTGRQSPVSSSQQVGEFVVGGEPRVGQETCDNQPGPISEQPTQVSYYSSRSGSESESESEFESESQSRSSSESGSGSRSTSESETSTTSSSSTAESRSGQSTEEFYDVTQGPDGTPSPTGIRWEDEPQALAEGRPVVSPGHLVQFQVTPAQKKLSAPNDFLAADKPQSRDSSKRETRPKLVERVSSPLFLRRLKTGRPFGESLAKSISRGKSYIERRRKARGRRSRGGNAASTNGGEVTDESGSDHDVDDADADEYLADNESDLDAGNSVAASSATEEQLTGNQLLLRSLTMDGTDPRRLEELVQQPAFQNMVYEQWKAQEKKEKEGKRKKSIFLKKDRHFVNDPLQFSLTARSAASEAIDPGQQVNDRPAKSFLRRAITGDFAGLRSNGTSSPANTGLPKHLTRSLYDEPLDHREDRTTSQNFGDIHPSDMSATYSSSVTSVSPGEGLNITFEDLPTPKPRAQRAISQTQMGTRLPSMEGPTEYQGADGSLYNINIDEEDGYTDLLPSFTTTLTGNYLSYQPTIGRNSTFVGLSQRQKNELGGVEYRAIKLLCNILLIYYFGITVIAFVFLVPWIIKRKYYANIVRGDGISPTWWGFFTSWGAFGNVGLSLAPDSMSSFSAAPYPIIIMSILIVIGNTGFPIMLRFIIWIMYKFSRDLSQIRESLGFLLDHPRRCFTMLFPGAATWYLLLSLVVLNVADLVLFIILDLDSSELDPLAKGYRIMDCLFQSISTRTAGYSVFNLVDLHVAMQVTYMLMMYISTLPTAISIRRTNVYEEQSLGLYGKMGSSDPDEEDESSEYDSDESEESEDSETSKTENSTSSSPHYDAEETAGQSSKNGTTHEHDSASKDQKAVKKKKNKKKTKKNDPESSTKSYIGAHLRRQLSYDLWFLFLSLFIICLCENGRIKDLEEPYFNVFSILFEIVSAYGTVGLSLGYPNTDTSFSAQFTTLSKLVIICLLIRGKNRGLPYSLDRAIMLPSERLDHIDQVTDLKLRRHISDIDDHDALNQYFKHKATRFVNKFRKVRRDIREEADGKHSEATKERVHLLEQGGDDEGA